MSLAVASALSPFAAMACSPGDVPAALQMIAGDRPIRVRPDCSFTRAGQSIADVGRGTAATDVGGGRVSQVVAFGEHTCSIDEYVLVADCGSREAVLIQGGENPDGEGTGIIHSADLVLKPRGPINIEKVTSIRRLSELAHQRGFAVVPGVDGFVSAMRKKNRFDPFCGCKLFYPDQAEASQ